MPRSFTTSGGKPYFDRGYNQGWIARGDEDKARIAALEAEVEGLRKAGLEFLAHLKEQDPHPCYVFLEGVSEDHDGPTADAEFIAFEAALARAKGA